MHLACCLYGDLPVFQRKGSFGGKVEISRNSVKFHLTKKISTKGIKD